MSYVVVWVSKGFELLNAGLAAEADFDRDWRREPEIAGRFSCAWATGAGWTRVRF